MTTLDRIVKLERQIDSVINGMLIASAILGIPSVIYLVYSVFY